MRFCSTRRRGRFPLAAVFAAAVAGSAIANPSAAEEEHPLRSVQTAQADATEPTDAEPAEEEADEPAPPSGAGEAEGPSGIEVMTVRGRSAGAIDTEVPASITQFDAATIEALGAQDISDLSRVTPNVNIVQPGSTQATFFVRGVGLSDFSSNATGAVTIFQDDVALNAAPIQTGQLYDVEGVEVLRGPQGSGPFRNASAGAITVRSRRPTGNFGAQLRTSLGRYDTKGDKGARNALIQDYEGALEMPIVEDALSSRFAFRLRDADPYKSNGCGNAFPFDQRLPFSPGTKDAWKNSRISQCGELINTSFPPFGFGTSTVPDGLPTAIGDEHNWAARGTLRFQPVDTETDFALSAHGSRLDQFSTVGQAIGVFGFPGDRSTVRFGGNRTAGANSYADRDVREEFEQLCQRVGTQNLCANPVSPGDALAKRLAERALDIRPYRGDYNRVGQTTRDAWGGFLSGEGAVFEDAKLSGLMSYDRYERFQETDTDFTPERLFEMVQSDEAWQMFHQLQLDGELASEPVAWNVGAYYLEEHLDNDGTIFLIPLVAGVADPESRRIYDQKTESFGVWGGFGWDFADDFTLDGGVRYNWERKEFDFHIIEQPFPLTDEQVSRDETWQTPTGELMLTYHINPDASAYARYTRGFKAGHFNALASTNLNEPPADEEYNDAWEAGLRGSWFDQRATLAGSFFYYRYENYQVFLFTDSADAAAPPVLEILNAKQAENFGIEVETTLLPLEGWAPRFLSGLRLYANFGWLHGEYIDFTTTREFLIQGVGAVSVPIDYSGKRLQNAPEYKVSATAEWTFDLGRYGYLIPRYDMNWSDDVFFDPNEGRGSVDPTGGPALIEYGVGQKAFFLHNVRLAYRTPTGNVELAGWIRNVDDEVYKNFAFDASRFSGIVINFPGEPRTVGFDLTFTF